MTEHTSPNLPCILPPPITGRLFQLSGKRIIIFFNMTDRHFPQMDFVLARITTNHTTPIIEVNILAQFLHFYPTNVQVKLG